MTEYQVLISDLGWAIEFYDDEYPSEDLLERLMVALRELVEEKV